MCLFTRLSQNEAERLRRQLSEELLCSPTEFDLDSLRRRHWVAAPVRDEITDQQAVWLEAAIGDMGESKGVSVTTEPGIHLEAYEVELSEEGLLRFHYNCMLRVFLLAPRSVSFAVLDQANYFYLLAGPKAFVEAALGRRLSEALDSFMHYAERITATPLTKKWLQETAARYRRY